MQEIQTLMATATYLFSGLHTVRETLLFLTYNIHYNIIYRIKQTSIACFLSSCVCAWIQYRRKREKSVFRGNSRNFTITREHRKISLTHNRAPVVCESVCLCGFRVHLLATKNTLQDQISLR